MNKNDDSKMMNDPGLPQHGIDWQTCLRIVNNDKIVAEEILTSFTIDLPAVIKLIEKLHQEKDFTKLLSVSHRLLGASCYCGVPYLTQLLRNFEQDIRANQIENLKNLIKEIKKESNLIKKQYANKNYY